MGYKKKSRQIQLFIIDDPHLLLISHVSQLIFKPRGLSFSFLHMVQHRDRRTDKQTDDISICLFHILYINLIYFFNKSNSFISVFVHRVYMIHVHLVMSHVLFLSSYMVRL